MESRDLYTNLVPKIKMQDFCKYCDSFAKYEYLGKLLCEDHFYKESNKIINIALYGSLLKS